MKKKSNTKVNNNHKVNALLEIGLEEVPSRFIPAVLADLKEKTRKELEALRIPSKSIQTLGTPRRLVLYIEGLPPKQDDNCKESKGPSKDIAYTNGTPSKALEGFIRSQGVTLKDIQFKKFGDKEFVFAKVTEKGRDIEDILTDLFPKLIKSLYLPISMRWGSVDFKFIRPLHWIFAACGKSPVSFEIAGIKSSNKTCGHRFFCPKPMVIDLKAGINLENYKKALLKGQVMLDQEERRTKITDMVKAAAKKLNGEALIDKDLLEEVNYLVEWPMAITGSFKKEYLDLPKDVLITSMKKNQKYFVVLDPSEKLLPNFINITNGIKAEDSRNVIEGNERVLTARLNDAKFFFEEDRKKFLADMVPALKKVAFYDKLGNIYQKVERVTALATWISNELKIPDSKKANIITAAELCKSDLLTHMVYEFPSLQGVMGREYALIEGKSKEVANALFEHYLPRFAEDKLPASIEGSVIGIADKIDSIVGCFSINIIPTGSEDPFALRRQAQGIVSVLMDKKLNIPLDELIERSYKLYEQLFLGEMFSSGKVKFNNVQKVIPDVLQFLAARLKGNLLESGIKYDVADAVITKFEDVLDVCEKAKVIQKSLKEEYLKGIVFTADRVSRLAKNAKRENVIAEDFVSDDERGLYKLYMDVNAEMNDSLAKDDYQSALRALSKFTKPIDEFFVKVMVMDKDERLKANRLALLKTIERSYMELADFSKIVM